MKTSFILAAVLVALPELAFADHGWLQKQLSITDGSPKGTIAYDGHDARGPQGRPAAEFGTVDESENASALNNWFERQRRITDGSVAR